MFEKLKANILFNKLLGRPNIDNAYKMVPETDSWYDTITKVHKSLDIIKKHPHDILEIKSHDNLTLKGIYYPVNSDTNVTIIFVHGYTSHAEREWAFPGLFYLSLGYNVLIPYQRAHGLSEGKYISFGALEHLDMMNWVKKINEINPESKIIIHGLSMGGGGIVLDLINKEMKNVKCLISDAPNVSIEMFFRNVSKQVFKNEGEKVASYALKRYKKEFKVEAKEFNAFDFIKDAKYPLLLSAGSNEHLEEVFSNLKELNHNQTDIIILPGCNHGNGMYKQTALYQEKIIDFLKTNL